jgi:hypothetical protein
MITTHEMRVRLILLELRLKLLAIDTAELARAQLRRDAKRQARERT